MDYEHRDNKVKDLEKIPMENKAAFHNIGFALIKKRAYPIIQLSPFEVHSKEMQRKYCEELILSAKGTKYNSRIMNQSHHRPLVYFIHLPFCKLTEIHKKCTAE